MKILVLVFLTWAAPLLIAADITLPAKLGAYEDFVVHKLQSGFAGTKEEGKIRVLVAAGDSDIVQRHEEMDVPAGSTVWEVGSLWRKTHQGLLVGWAQGLVVIRRKDGDKVDRIAWTTPQARTEGSKFQLRNGDILIGIGYADY